MQVDVRLILLHAEEFRRAGIVMGGDERNVKELPDPHIMYPKAMCNAFAFELYLKFLLTIVTGREPPRIHDFRKLYDKLPREDAMSIRRKWENPAPSQAALRSAVAKALGREHPNFDETLDQASQAFERLRYAYQYPNETIIWIAGDITECTRHYIYQKHPTEYSDVRLPLPPNAVNTATANVTMQMVVNADRKNPEPWSQDGKKPMR